MKRIIALLSLLLAPAIVGVGWAEEEQDPPKTAWPGLKIDDRLQELLDKINSVGPYEVPDLGVRKDENYAHTPQDIEPFGSVKPYKEHFLVQMEYTGPGRSIPEPEHLDSVKLGFIGPIMSTVSVATGGKSHEEALGIQMLRGTRLAIEEANARGGYTRRGIPFELVISNDNGLWGASGNEIVKMAYKDRVWAILGTIDGANSHIAIRVALKAEVVMMNTGDTDPTFIETNIPWVARVIGDDRQQGYLLADYLYRKVGYERVGIIRASNRYGRFGVREIRDTSRRLGRPVALEMAYEVGSDDFSLHLERLEKAGVQAIVHWGDAQESALILNQMRAMGMNQPYFASDRSVSDEFVDIAGDNAHGVICVYSWDPTREDPRLEIFRENFRKRFGVEADTFAAHAYDGMNMLIWAVETVGLNRAKIRDVLAYMIRPWPGVTGDIVLSAALDDVGEVFLARFEEGEWNYYSRDDLEIPRGHIPARDRLNRSSIAPYFDATTRQATYEGPGRDDPPPSDPEEVRIGYFGPTDPDHPEGGDPWLAAGLAVEEANRSGGYRDLPFRLVPAWSDNPWSTGVARLARMAYEDDLWAVIGSVDGASTHLAEQVVAKARLTLIGPAATDKTVNLANVAWMFSFLPSDDRQADLLAEAISREIGPKPFTLVSSTDHDSRAATAELRASLRRRGIGPLHHLELAPGAGDPAKLAKRVAAGDPEAVVILAGAFDSARLVTALSEQGIDVRVFGGPSMGRRVFAETAGRAADGTIFPLLCETISEDFAGTFESRFGRRPDCVTAQTYDATRMLIAAIRKAGLNRARIREAVRALSPWPGVAGTVEWNPLGQNRRDVRIATFSNGGAVPVDLAP